MMRAPLSSVKGPEATSRPLSRRLARYWRWTGRWAAILALSWLYSMMAANFISGLIAGGSGLEQQFVLDRPDAGRGKRPQNTKQSSVKTEQPDGKTEIAQKQAKQGITG